MNEDVEFEAFNKSAKKISTIRIILNLKELKCTTAKKKQYYDLFTNLHTNKYLRRLS